MVLKVISIPLKNILNLLSGYLKSIKLYCYHLKNLLLIYLLKPHIHFKSKQLVVNMLLLSHIINLHNKIKSLSLLSIPAMLLITSTSKLNLHILKLNNLKKSLSNTLLMKVQEKLSKHKSLKQLQLMSNNQLYPIKRLNQKEAFSLDGIGLTSLSLLWPLTSS